MEFKLQTKNLTLVPLVSDYFLTADRYSRDIDNTHYMVNLPNNSSEETMEFLKKCELEWEKDEPSFMECAVIKNQTHIGAVCVYFDKDRLSGETGWIIDKTCWGKGYAGEAAGALIEYCANKLNIRRFVAHCDSENFASQSVMKKLGFVQISQTGGRYNRAGSEERKEIKFELVIKKKDDMQ